MTASKKKKLNKTPTGKRFTRQLVRVNDQLCFAALQQSEFLKQLQPLAQARAEEFTTDVFPENHYAVNIHRKIGDLEQFSKQAEQVALQMGIIAAVEYVLAYMNDVQHLKEELQAHPATPIHHDAEEEKLKLNLELWSDGIGKRDIVKAEYFRTIGYFRLLRNHYAHVNEEPSKAFSECMRLQGTLLNRFWEKQITDLHGVDFKSFAVTDLTPSLAFGVISLLRVCVQLIDQMVVDTLSLEEIIEWEVSEYSVDPKSKKLSTERLSSKISARLRMNWNIKVTANGIVEQVEASASNIKREQ